MQLLDMLAVILEKHLRVNSRSDTQVENLADLCQKVLREGDASLLPALQDQLAHMLWQPDDPKNLYRIEKACEICRLDPGDDQSNPHLLVSLWLDG